MSAAYVHPALYALLDLVSLSLKFTLLLPGVFMIALINIDFYCFYRQRFFLLFGFIINYTALRPSLVIAFASFYAKKPDCEAGEFGKFCG